MMGEDKKILVRCDHWYNCPAHGCAHYEEHNHYLSGCKPTFCDDWLVKCLTETQLRKEKLKKLKLKGND